MIRLGKMTMYNFGIYKGTVELDFNGRDIVGVLAEYDENPNRSNRSGKTLILEAIRYNLTGLCRAKKEVAMIHDGEDHMWVECIYLDQDDNEYNIRRGRDIKNNGVLNLDWVEKTTEAQIAITELFGVSKDDFDLTCFFKQSDINGFMDLSPTEKTSFLMKWLDNEHWKDKETAVKADMKVYKDRLRDNEVTLKALDSSMEVTEELEEECKGLKKENEVNLKADKDISKKLKECNAKLAKLNAKKDESKDQIRKLKSDVESAIKSSNTLAVLKVKLEDLKNDGLANKKIITKYKDLKPEKLKADLVKVQGEKRDMEKHLEMLHSGDGICPILNEVCDRVAFNAGNIDPCEDAISDFALEVKELREKISNAEKAVSAIKEVKTLRERYVETQERLRSIKDGQSVEDAKEAYNKAKKATSFDDSELNAMIDKYESSLEDITSDVNRNNHRIGSLENRMKTSGEALDKMDAISDKNEKLKKRLEELNYLALMFGKNGIPADEIENAFQEVQDDINFVLKAIDCGLTVSFSPDKELSKWESICVCGFRYYKGYRKGECKDCGSPRLKQRKDEISLTILEGDKEADFGMDSGGGKTIISYAVRIALTMLKRRQNKSKLNILFLDEVDSALDSHLASSITDSITKILTKKLGYDQILMVSHKDEIKKSVPHILKVTRYDSHSTAEFV